MFKINKWFHRGWIESNEGFAVAIGRSMVVYREAGRKMAVTADVGAGQANIFTISVGRWVMILRTP
jgi:actin-like ATPase involved in cell morphogenesis